MYVYQFQKYSFPVILLLMLPFKFGCTVRPDPKYFLFPMVLYCKSRVGWQGRIFIVKNIFVKNIFSKIIFAKNFFAKNIFATVCLK